MTDTILNITEFIASLCVIILCVYLGSTGCTCWIHCSCNNLKYHTMD